MKWCLDRLRRLELAQPSGAYLGDEPVWRFHHVLIRDVAYRRLLKSDRADLHERLADWVEAGGATLASTPTRWWRGTSNPPMATDRTRHARRTRRRARAAVCAVLSVVGASRPRP